MARVLLVDDDDLIRPLCVEILGMAGHEVVEAADGDSALRAAGQGRFDVLVTDIIMPGKDGLETIMAIRRKQPGIRILAVSGGGRLAADSYLTVAKPLGADATLTKPFEPRQLIEAVRKLLG
jgi:CheY-like chemotaxis protein